MAFRRKCGQCYNKPKGEAQSKSACTASCAVWNIIFLTCLFALTAGVPCLVAGVLGSDFLDQAVKENVYTRVDCMLVKLYKEFQGGDSDWIIKYYMCRPSGTDPVACILGDRVVEMEVNAFTSRTDWINVLDAKYQDNTGANRIDSMVVSNCGGAKECDKGEIELDDEFTLETCYEYNPGPEEDYRLSWDLDKGLESGFYTDVRTAGMVLTIVGLIGSLPLLFFAAKGCPTCVGVATTGSLAVAFTFFFITSLISMLIGFLTKPDFTGTDSKAGGIGLAMLVVCVLSFIGLVVQWGRFCCGMAKIVEANKGNTELHGETNAV